MMRERSGISILLGLLLLFCSMLGILYAQKPQYIECITLSCPTPHHIFYTEQEKFIKI